MLELLLEDVTVEFQQGNVHVADGCVEQGFEVPAVLRSDLEKAMMCTV